MELDRWLACNMNLYDSTDPGVDYWMKKWSSPCGWNSYDRIEMTEDELNNLIYQLENMSYSGSDLILRPALEEFTLRIGEPLRMEETLICFKRTVLPRSDKVEKIQGTVRTTAALIDAYAHLNNGGQCADEVITLGKHVMSTKKDTISMTFSSGAWVSYNNPFLHTYGMKSQEMMEFERTVKLAYMAIQKALYDRPALFRERTEKISVQQDNISSRNSQKKRVVNAVRIIRLNPDEFKNLLKAKIGYSRKITCPCWGVIGHTRRYKSGKEVWVKPYKKGKERKKPDVYSAKKYEIVKGGSANA